jgi:hypothetical protein
MTFQFVPAKATNAHWGSFRHLCNELYSLPTISGREKFVFIPVEECLSDGRIVPVTALKAIK